MRKTRCRKLKELAIDAGVEMPKPVYRRVKKIFSGLSDKEKDTFDVKSCVENIIRPLVMKYVMNLDTQQRAKTWKKIQAGERININI
jgi:hypothetical protein